MTKNPSPTGTPLIPVIPIPPTASLLPSGQPAIVPDSTRASWTVDDEAALIDFLHEHAAEAGDGLNFKGSTWTAASKAIDSSRTKGAAKTALACKNKFSAVSASVSRPNLLLMIGFSLAEGAVFSCVCFETGFRVHMG